MSLEDSDIDNILLISTRVQDWIKFWSTTSVRWPVTIFIVVLHKSMSFTELSRVRPCKLRQNCTWHCISKAFTGGQNKLFISYPTARSVLDILEEMLGGIICPPLLQSCQVVELLISFLILFSRDVQCWWCTAKTKVTPMASKAGKYHNTVTPN